MNEAELDAADILQNARNILQNVEAMRLTASIRRAQIRLDMMIIGYEAVQRKIADGHPYGTANAALGNAKREDARS